MVLRSHHWLMLEKVLLSRLESSQLSAGAFLADCTALSWESFRRPEEFEMHLQLQKDRNLCS
jgi:hypothetical protein